MRLRFFGFRFAIEDCRNLLVRCHGSLRLRFSEHAPLDFGERNASAFDNRIQSSHRAAFYHRLYSDAITVTVSVAAQSEAPPLPTVTRRPLIVTAPSHVLSAPAAVRIWTRTAVGVKSK